MDITLNAVAFRGGVPVQTELNLTQRPDGTWHATNFGDILKQTDSASKPQNRDTYEGKQARLSDQEIAGLAGKYNLHNMTRSQYDAFLDDLIEAGALSRFDAMRLGHHGWRILDINAGDFASGGIGCGSARVNSGGNQPIQSLEDADGDLARWLESMLAQQDQGENKGLLNLLSDIVRRMQAA